MGRFLLVEDDDSLRYMTSEMLRCFKHETVQAENGFVALEILMRDTAFDAVITDLRMPVVDGLHLTAIIKVEYPWIPVIATSVNETLLLKAENGGSDGTLQKPFTCTQLLATLAATAHYAERAI